ncbi:MAG: hypothetical protein ACYTAS_01395 [Planctomycetota bacterium]|jgi:hypothetical protein
MEPARDKPNVISPGKGEPEATSVRSLTREDWIRRYTGRIFRAWFRRETPLGLAWTYANWIRRELSDYYGQPLMKAFIERTFASKRDREA